MLERRLVVPTLVGLITVSFVGEVAGQTPEREPVAVELPSSTRAAGLGGAYQVGAPDSDVIFYNPALLGRANGILVGVHAFGGEALGLTFSHARDFFGGAVGIGFQGLEFGSDGPGRRSGGLDPILADGVESVGELVATTGYARSIYGFDVGIAAKLISQRFATFRQASGAIDVGVGRRVGRVTLGLAAQDLGPDRELSEGVKVPQPLRGTLTAGSYGLQVGPLDVGGSAALTVRDDGEVVGGGGVEVGYWPVSGRTFVARIGARGVPEGEAWPVTFGASYWGDDLVIEYAFQGVDDLDNVHRFTVGWR